jgi:hypothetical protein
MSVLYYSEMVLLVLSINLFCAHDPFLLLALFSERQRISSATDKTSSKYYRFITIKSAMAELSSTFIYCFAPYFRCITSIYLSHHAPQTRYPQGTIEPLAVVKLTLDELKNCRVECSSTLSLPYSLPINELPAPIPTVEEIAKCRKTGKWSYS